MIKAVNGLERYQRHLAFSGIGEEGQKSISRSRVAIVGMGALGCAIANSLCRAGFGYLRLIDPDLVELSNLQRQILYNEKDAFFKKKKAPLAKERLSEVNSQVSLEAITEKMDAHNISALLSQVDMVLDGLDNFESRLIINDYCVKNSLPYIYGAVLADSGVTMNIMPGGPCLRCIMSKPLDKNSTESPETKGVLNQIVSIIAAIQSAEATKLAVKSPLLRRSMLSVSVWDYYSSEIYMEAAKNCICQKQ